MLASLVFGTCLKFYALFSTLCPSALRTLSGPCWAYGSKIRKEIAKRYNLGRPSGVVVCENASRELEE